MIKNYLSLALKVLRRKPFYTFISLFGISFTLMILMLITAMGDAMFGANPPISDVNQMVFLPQAERIKQFYDTTYVVDSVLMDDGTMRYDSTADIKEGGRNNSSGNMAYNFLDETLRDLDHVESYTFYSNQGFVVAYLEGSKVTMQTCYTDADYWRVFDFNFLHGVPFTADAVEGADKVAVITEKTAQEYFGRVADDVIGKEMELGRDRFTVTGIVARPLKDDDVINGGVFLPYTTIDARSLKSDDISGPFNAAFKADDKNRTRSVIDQIHFIAENYDMSGDEDYETLKLKAATATEKIASEIMQDDDFSRAKLLLFIPLVVLLSLFLALPLINLINLGVSRVYERKSEIAVRKSFGADSRDILYQFLFENMVLTVIGGAIGLVLALLLITYINANDLLGIVRLAFSLKVFLYFLLVIALFGFLSGILPALRMSRTNIANALR
jgi:putative ABC transport system permease protein